MAQISGPLSIFYKLLEGKDGVLVVSMGPPSSGLCILNTIGRRRHSHVHKLNTAVLEKSLADLQLLLMSSVFLKLSPEVGVNCHDVCGFS